MFKTKHFAAHHGADTTTVSVHDLLAFGIANLLVQELLCSLDGLTTEGGNRNFHFEEVTGLCVFVEVAGFFHQHVTLVELFNFGSGHVRVVVRIVIHHGHAQVDMHLVGFHVEIHIDLLFDVQVLAGSRHERFLQRVQHDRIIHILGFDDTFQHFEQVNLRFFLTNSHFRPQLYLYIHFCHEHFATGHDHVTCIAFQGERQILFVRSLQFARHRLTGTAGHPDKSSDVAGKIGNRLQGAVQPRRRHFERVGTFDNIRIGIQRIGQVTAHVRAIVNRNPFGLVYVKAQSLPFACAEHVLFHQCNAGGLAGLGDECIQLLGYQIDLV